MYNIKDEPTKIIQWKVQILSWSPNSSSRLCKTAGIQCMTKKKNLQHPNIWILILQTLKIDNATIQKYLQTYKQVSTEKKYLDKKCLSKEVKKISVCTSLCIWKRHVGASSQAQQFPLTRCAFGEPARAAITILYYRDFKSSSI